MRLTNFLLPALALLLLALPARAASGSGSVGYDINSRTVVQPDLKQKFGGAEVAGILTNRVELRPTVYLGTSTNVAIDPYYSEYIWVLSANGRFQFATNSLSGTNMADVLHIQIYATASSLQVTNVVNTFTARGNWGALKAGWNELEILFKNSTNFISQDTAQIPATQLADGTVSDAEFETLDGVTSSIQTQLTAKQAGPLTGDVTTSGAAATIPSGTVTYAKMQTVSTGSILLGRGSSGSGAVQELSLGSGLSITGTTISSSGGSGLDIDFYATSTNATTNAVWTYTLPASMSAEVTLWGAGIGTTNYLFGHRLSASYRRSGTASLIDSTLDFYRSSATPNAYFDLSGNDMVLVCNAITNETFNWHIKGVLALVTNSAASGGISSPLDVAGCVLWLDGSDATKLYTDSGLTTLVSANNDPVGGWKDKSAATQDFTQSTSGNRAVYKTSIQNSKSCVYFDGSTSFLTKTMGSLSAHTVFIVSRSGSTSSGAYETLLIRASDGLGFYHKVSDGTGAFTCNLYSGGDHLSASSSVNTFVAFTGALSGSAGAEAAYKNDSSFSTFDFYNNVTYDRLGGHGSEFLNGYIAEIVVYDTQLGSTDRESVQTYLYNKWLY